MARDPRQAKSMPRRRRRAPVLTEGRVERVVGIIRDWRGRLTWEALCEAVERETGARYTRQALNNHVPIRAAYEVYRERPSPAEGDKEPTGTQRRIQIFQREVYRLREENRLLLEKFARWAYNAAARGLSEEFLDRPLPDTARSRGNRRPDADRCVLAPSADPLR